MRRFSTLCTVPACLFTLALGGCVVDASSSQGGAAFDDVDIDVESTDANLMRQSFSADGGVKRPTLTPGAGWLDVPNAPLKPFCGAVRIDDEHIVTSHDCTTQTYNLRFGTGAVGEDGVVVTAVESMAHEPRLSMLELAKAPGLDGMAEPTRLDTRSDAALDGERVRGLSFDYTPREEESGKWTFEGTLSASEAGLTVLLDATDEEEGAPNCHGDSGAGIYTEAGDLVGLVVAVSGSSTGMGCVTELVLARP